MSAAELYVDLRERGFRLRIDDELRLRVSPGNRLTAADRVAVRRHRDDLLAMVGIDGEHAEESIGTTEPVSAPRAVPSGCVGPRACRVLGVCGRWACVPDMERAAFEVAVFNARATGNPHRVIGVDHAPELAA